MAPINYAAESDPTHWRGDVGYLGWFRLRIKLARSGNVHSRTFRFRSCAHECLCVFTMCICSRSVHIIMDTSMWRSLIIVHLSETVDYRIVD